ncbi:reticulocalbin-2 isoform X2 [Pectinophora gossypiella]|uniref:reticulocalbin-2 isoform X2 n=1 Tax=Pectinophora gossypiella TaxID=13191 RepID=UPI00214EFD99|nr:reticulocalbin-2 isoform X2 [Pectinophora gossypiella]
MASHYWLSVLLVLSHNLLDCTSAAVHGNSLENAERESDGSYRARDAEHYGDSGHNVEFDHEAILGSVKEAEEFDKLSPDESKERLAQLLPRMDINGDKHIDRKELKQWILNSFSNLSNEEAEERLQEADDNKDGVVTWQEYLQDTFGADTEEEVAADDTNDAGLLVAEEKAMWKAADTNGDGSLDHKEFEVFTNPEEHAVMHPFLINQTLREKDTNKDGRIDFQEYIGDRGSQQDRSWLVSEREKFDHELDTDHDGVLDMNEIHQWVIPNNDEIADEEVDHLFQSADDDRDDMLSFEEVISHYDVFVGSEADYGNDILGDHFDDEL